MKYDDASWHSGGEFPKGQPEEHGGTHIGLFLKWCFLKGWAGPNFTSEEVEPVASGQMTGTCFLFEHCDGKLVDEDLSVAGRAFADRYYGDDGLYLDDYAQHFGDLMYLVPETSHDFVKFSAVLEARLQTGVLTKSELPKGLSAERTSAKAEAKPWWKFW